MRAAVATVFAILAACSAEPAPSAAPIQSGAADLGKVAGLAFNLPDGWQIRPQDISTRAGTVIAYAGTAPSEYRCETSPVSISCSSEWNLGPNQVSVEILTPARPGEPLWEGPLAPGESRVVVGGLPASFRVMDSGAGADRSFNWSLSKALEPFGSYHLIAAIRGPDVDVLRTQLDEFIASIHYDPPVPVLQPGAAQDLAVGRALERLSGEDVGFSCFPRAANAGETALVEMVPGYPQLAQPLGVVCLTGVEATPIGVWQMNLTMTWESTPEHAAGRLVTKVWIDASGEVVGESQEAVEVPFTP